jgi:hypothetical protein
MLKAKLEIIGREIDEYLPALAHKRGWHNLPGSAGFLAGFVSSGI